MLRMQVVTDVASLSGYLGKGDGGYFVEQSGLHRETGGDICERLGLIGPDFKKFLPLMHGLDPNTGEQLTAKLIDNRIPGWHLTASVPKGVTIALERGDDRIHNAIWEATRETIADVSRMVTTRVRQGGVHDDRLTNSLGYYAEEHAETRPAKADNRADMDRHIHILIPNVTWDAAEQQFKAIKFRPIMDLRKYFDRRFDLRLSSKLTDLGYEIDTKSKQGKYYSWDIKDIPQSVVKKFSRRAEEVEKLAADLGIDNPVSKDKLGATSRQHKRDDMTLADYREYWDKRVTAEEGKKIAEVIKRAMLEQNPRPQNTAEKGVSWAVQHLFERNSVVAQKDLEITAMERCMGGARPEEIEPECQKQGVLTKEGESTTKQVLFEEGRIIRFAREGRGTMRPLGSGPHRTGAGLTAQGRSKQSDTATLSPEQQAICRHVWDSTDQVILIRGAAGTGKTHTMKTAIAGIDKPVAVLAPSADASRGVLRREGFQDADTVASFLGSAERQRKVKNGVIWVDEAGLLPVKDLAKLTGIAREQNAHLILQGDPKQHRSIARDGNMFQVLQQYAGLPVAELRTIRRQENAKHREAVSAIESGDILKGHGIIRDLGWINRMETPQIEKAIANECWNYLKADESFIVVGITHKQNDAITEELRNRLRKEGKLGTEERTFDKLVPVGWTEAQKGDLSQYEGTETLQYHRNSGSFKAGDRIRIADWKSGQCLGNAEHFAVYHPDTVRLSVGDTVRITANGWSNPDRNGKRHRLDNGSKYTVSGFTKEGNIALENGWVIDKKFGHIGHGLVDTSFKAQGQTKIRAIGALTHQNLPGINAEQYYVTMSRSKLSAKIFTDLPDPVIREMIQKQDTRKSATELMSPEPKKRKKRFGFFKKIKERFKQLREKANEVMMAPHLERGAHAR